MGIWGGALNMIDKLATKVIYLSGKGVIDRGGRGVNPINGDTVAGFESP